MKSTIIAARKKNKIWIIYKYIYKKYIYNSRFIFIGLSLTLFILSSFSSQDNPVVQNRYMRSLDDDASMPVEISGCHSFDWLQSINNVLVSRFS